MKTKQNFNDVVEAAMRHGDYANLRPVVEKEILHYEIFAALYKNDLLSNLVFQGGTSLRLCRGSNRFSEDLDFAGGFDFDINRYAEMRAVIETHIGERFDLEVTVKDPRGMREENDAEGVNVDRWQIAIQTSPDRKDIPKQRIKLEVASVPAHTRELTPVKTNYEMLSGYENMLVQSETLPEIMADKLLAFPMAKNIRHRDIWDLAWMRGQRNVKFDAELLKTKLRDYSVSEDDFMAKTKHRLETLEDIIHGEDFHNQMKRFIDQGTIKETLDKAGFKEYLVSDMRDSLTSAMTVFDKSHTPAPFKM